MTHLHEWQPWPGTKPRYKSGFYQVQLKDGRVLIAEMIQGKFQVEGEMIAWRLLAYVGDGDGSKKESPNR